MIKSSTFSITQLIITSFCLSFFSGCVNSSTLPESQNIMLHESIKHMDSMAKRIFADRASSFVFEVIPSSKGEDVFEIESRQKKIVIRGNNGIAMARGLNWYLKYYCDLNFSWENAKVVLPDELPQVFPKLQRICWAENRYFLNYCAFGYSMPWWDWKQWEKLIDWMALNGINMPLSVTGQEAVWQRVCRKMGMSDAEIMEFFAGAPYLPFSWMGCLDSWGGPLPKDWIDRHAELQQKILLRQRELGMKPVLQGFTGHIPEAIYKKFPNAKGHTVQWYEWKTHLLDPNEPLYTKIAALYMKEQTELFGTDHLYAADPFIEMIPPKGDLNFLTDYSRAIYRGMAQVDSQAVWVFQSWPFMDKKSFWTQQRIKAFFDAVDDNHMIVLDLFCEKKPLWKATKAFYGKPWIWCNIQNFGNTTFMNGNLDIISKDLQAAKNNPQCMNLSGAGFVNEGLGYNPVVFDLLFEIPWRKGNIILNKWVKDYANHRYGGSNIGAEKAWTIFQNTLYNKSFGSNRSIIINKPSISYQQKLPYDNVRLIAAWRLLQEESDKLGSHETFRYDLVNVARQTLANHALKLHEALKDAYNAKDEKMFAAETRNFLELIDDMDQLLGTRKEFLLGAWIEDAKRWGRTKSEKDKLEWNARRILTIWGDSPSLNDYSYKEWSGMLSGFYSKRWLAYFKELQLALKQKKVFDNEAVIDKIFEWEKAWSSQLETYPSEPTGNCIEISQKLLVKYFGVRKSSK